MPVRLLYTAFPILAALLIVPEPAWAIRFGSLGNAPIDAQPGWPAGADAVFNVNQRIAFWEHNGKWTSDCRGDTEAFNQVLIKFAKVDCDTKRLVVHDGVSTSYWVGAVDKSLDPRIDWMFVVWDPEHWRMWQSIGRGEATGDPPVPQIDVYVGGNIRWDDVQVPKGIQIVDQRLEAHGFTLADGNVIEGTVRDVASGKPLAASMKLVQMARNDQGSYDYTTVRSVDCDEHGRWVITSAPHGQHQVVVSAEGYVAKTLGYAEFTEQPSWSAFDAELAPAATLSGTVTDESGKPLAGATVRLDSSYGLATSTLVTDESGRFRTAEVPVGPMSLRATMAGYVFAGLGQAVEVPDENVRLTLSRGGRLEVVVDFGGNAKPENYLVHIAPPGGEKVGSWGGSADVDASGFYEFKDVPPGEYMLWGRPNPGSDDQQTDKVTVEVKAGETTQVKLDAK